MDEEEAIPPIQTLTTPPATPPGDPPPPPPSQPPSPPPPPRFNPSRMIGIIRRKALIKELAAVYHAECLAYCQELLEFQRKWEEPYLNTKIPEDSRKDPLRPPKRLKKTR